MQRHYFTAFTPQPRHTALNSVKALLDRHAIILNSQWFSDVALGLLLELPRHNLLPLLTALQAECELKGDWPQPSDATQDCLLFFNITFGDGGGNLRREVPMVPG